ncbi:MAG TPA: sulfite exporter TauE/SafE family protein, partial [Hyphomicrobiales bacterium]
TLKRAMPLLAGGVVGVPFGVAALSLVPAAVLRSSIGLFLVGYALFQLGGWTRLQVGAWGGRKADAAVGLGGGFLGGFAGLSAPLPVIWLQLRGLPAGEQRAVYQPFNLLILALASLGMAVSGQIDAQLVAVAAAALPVTLAGAWIGARVYRRFSEESFRRIVLALLLASGLILVAQAF